MKLLYEQKTEIRLTHPKGVDFSLHVHEALELVFVQKGSFDAILGNQRYTAGPGDVFVAFPNLIHAYENTRDFQGYVLIVPVKPYLAAFRSVFEKKTPVKPVLHLDVSLYEQLQTLFQFGFADRKSTVAPILHGYALAIVGKLLETMALKDLPSGNDALQSVLSYISKHYTEQLRRADIAKAVGYNESYISHLFSDSLNTSLTDFVTTLRLNDARRMLRDTELPVSRIAMTTGFASIRCFNRIFSRDMGIPPTAYRNQYRK